MYERMQSGRVYGTVRLGIAGSYETVLLPRLLRHMFTSHADAELDIRCMPSWRLQKMMEARALDLAVVTLPEEDSSAFELCRPQLHWVGAPGLALDRGAPVPVAWHREHCFFQSAGCAALKDQGIAYRVVLRSVDARVVLAAVEAGMAVTVMAEGTVPESLRVLSIPTILPPLGKAVIQLLVRPGLQSEASTAVKLEIERVYREAEAPVT